MGSKSIIAEKTKKIILHLCADLGSDSLFYQLSDEYELIMVGEVIGVENYHPPENVHGIIANPVCTEFSTAKCFTHVGDIEKGMFLVNHCLRIIKEAQPTWWVIENPFNGRLKEILGKEMFFRMNAAEEIKKEDGKIFYLLRQDSLLYSEPS